MYRLFFVLLVLFFSGCSLHSFLKIRTAFEEEFIDTRNFKEEIPFEVERGMIIVEVEIGGKSKRMIFDTGANTYIDKETAKSIEATSLGKRKSVDTNNKVRYLKYAKIDKLKVGSIPFNSIVASVQDLDILTRKACLNIDGILGSNIMNKAIWQIDYEKQIITLTDRRDSLDLQGNEQKIHFYATGKGTPMVDMRINNNYIGEAAFDTGYNGSIALNMSKLPADIKFLKQEVISTGVHSSEENVNKIARINQVKIGSTFELKNKLINFNDRRTYGLIGTAIIKKYVVTYDWINREILLSENLNPKDNKYRSFGFFPTYHNEEFIVATIYPDAPAYKQGMRLNDKILSLNGIDFTENIYEKYCNFLDSSLDDRTVTQLEVEFERGDSVMILKLDEINLFDKL